MVDKEPLQNPIDVRFKTVTRYHYYFFFLYFFGTRFPSVWHLLNFLFLAPPMSYTCEGTNEINYCPCAKPEWNTSVFTKTIQMKYDLLCDTKWMISLSETLCVSGLLIGSLIFGSLSDRFGRLKTLCFSSFILATAGCLVTVMPNVASFIVMRMVEGIGMAGVIVSGYVLCIEYCGIKYRETISAILHIPINLGHMALAGISYSLRNCDHFQLAVSAPMYFTILYWWIMLESPKWLLDKNRRKKAVFTMEKFCVFNKGPDCETITAEMESYQTGPRGQSLKFHQIFKNRAMIKNVLCMAYLSFNCGLGYYGVTQFIGKMSGNIHLNTVIGGSFLVPGSLLAILLLNKMKRKSYIILTNVISGVFILIVVAIPSTFQPTWIRILCAGLSNSGFYMLFGVIFLYCVELFPTSARNSALGCLSVMSRVGQMAAPQINNLSQMAAGIVFGVFSLVGIFIVLPMPETKGRELPSDADYMPITNQTPSVSVSTEKQMKLSTSGQKVV